MASEPKKVNLQAPVDSRLVELLYADAEKRGCSANEIVAEVLAAYYKRPDLVAIPRKRLGRPFSAKKKPKK
jgi:hypothetical protein